MPTDSNTLLLCARRTLSLGHQSCESFPLDLLGGQSYSERKFCLTIPAVSMQPIQHRSDECITRADSATKS